MGDEPDLKINEKTGCFFTYVLHSDKEGLFKGIEYAPEIMPFIYRKVIYKSEGDKVETFDGAGKALGILFLHVDDEQTMKGLSERMSSLVSVKLS